MSPQVPSLQAVGTFFCRVSQTSFLQVIPWPCHGSDVALVSLAPAPPLKSAPPAPWHPGPGPANTGCAERALAWGQVACHIISALQPVGRAFRSLADPTLILSISSQSNLILLCPRLYLVLTVLLLQSVVSIIDMDVPTKHHHSSCWVAHVYEYQLFP